MRASSLKALAFLSLLTGSGTAAAAEGQPLQGIRRVVFVGDSITYAGQYIDFLEAYLRIKYPQLRCEFLDLGLPRKPFRDCPSRDMREASSRVPSCASGSTGCSIRPGPAWSWPATG